MIMTERQKRENLARGDSDDRRRAPRHDAANLGNVITRVIGGGEVKLLDFSRSGVLIESDSRLSIGAKATVRLTTTDASLTVRGQVVRSKVAGLNGRIVYHTALALDDDLTALEKVVPSPKKELKNQPEPDHEPMDHDQPELAASDESSGSEHAYLADLDTGVEASADPILEFLAT